LQYQQDNITQHDRRDTMCNTASRSLRQEELDAYFRQEFISSVLTALAPSGFMQQGRAVRFLIHKQNYTLVVIEQKGAGEWEFSVGTNYRYTYHLSHLIDMLEQIYKSGAEVIALQGEAAITATHRTANPDAEPDTFAQ